MTWVPWETWVRPGPLPPLSASAYVCTNTACCCPPRPPIAPAFLFLFLLPYPYSVGTLPQLANHVASCWLALAVRYASYRESRQRFLCHPYTELNLNGAQGDEAVELAEEFT